MGVAALPAHAAETVWSGQWRVRAEGFDRTFEGRRAEWDILQRIRVGVDVTVSPEVRLFAQVRDSRLWGAESGTLADTRNVDLHQGYVQLSSAIRAVPFRARAGRQEISYGDERMFGAAGWDNVGRSFDGFQARLARGWWTSDLLAARLVDDTAATTGSNDDLFLSYNRFAAAAGDRGLEAYVAYRSTPQTASTGISSFETSLGERLFASRGRWRIEEELVYQLGSRDGQDLRAYLATVQAYVELGGRTTLGAGCDLLSGDGDPSDGRESFFDVQRIFHTGHKFYGIMDRAEQVAGRAGLLDPYVALLGPGPRGGTTRLDVHFFRVLEADVLQNGVAASRGEANLGVEVDGVVTLPVVDAFKIEAGAALWLAGSRLEAAGATADSWWSYLQGIASF